MPTRPVNFKPVHFDCLPKPEVYSQMVLGGITAAAASFVDLLVVAGNAFDAGADAAAVRARAEGADLEPVVGLVFPVPLLPFRIAAQQLRDIVYGINNDIHVAVVIEIPKGTTAGRDRLEDGSAEFFREVLELSGPQVVIDNPRLAVQDVHREPLDFWIDV